MKKLYFSFILLASLTFYAQKPVFTQAKIESARVYTNAAELKHKASVQIPSGNSEIVITNVADYLIENTVQIKVPKNVTVMSVQFSNAYLEEYDNKANSPLLKTVQDSLTLLKSQLAKIENLSSSDQKAIELLDKNQQISNSQNFSVIELSKLVDYYKTKRTELNNSLDAFIKQEDELNKKISNLESRLSFNQTTVENQSDGKLIVNITSSQAGNIPLEIIYLTSTANWKPSYDLRIDKINDPIQMLYKAQVIQRTGVDWKNIKLSLTSGLANANTQAPELNSWFLDYYRTDVYGDVIIDAYRTTSKSKSIAGKDVEGRPNATYVQTLQNQVPGVEISTGAGQPGASNAPVVLRGAGSIPKDVEPLYVVDGVPMNGDSFKKINPEEIINIDVLRDAGSTSIYGNRGVNGVIVVTTLAGINESNMNEFTEMNESQLNLSFDIDIPYTIISNGKTHSVTLKEIKIPATYSYIAIPKLDLNAYLVAKINDYGNYNILPGEANVIFEDLFVGKTFINPNAKNNELQLSLGKDANIAISRKLVSDKSGTKMLSSRKVQDFVYEISVRNNKKVPIEIMLEDQIPISSNNDIEITVTEKDGANINTETGKMIWNLNIKSNETKKVRFGYQIKSAKEKNLEI
ncbi:mucoidy inhibitor MuiA family protein [Paenimyroides tangerinum]|uniref:Mucoidy inhibitor MuiA family protein n=1 Tax=Paenimyroides tangerinum TaxID=2488728 RepID=A0A3P3W5D5_9FLAO|nr:mucoidy inhibitor MuiA family protein [Paenimyroides tangerinum]RRJ89658.1 mucoidy inhibitor MuiA family protein [Paenimyroides tangerinum]